MSKYLIVVDMQKDFVDGALGTQEAVAILPRVKEKIAEYRAAGDKVIFTRDTHLSDYMSTNAGKHLPVVHCIKGTAGWQIYDGLEVGNATVIDKPTFGYLGWAKHIENGSDLSIELVGLCTDICVVSNAMLLKNHYPEMHILVDASCCAGVTKESHNAALTTMKMCQIEVL